MMGADPFGKCISRRRHMDTILQGLIDEINESRDGTRSPSLGPKDELEVLAEDLKVLGILGFMLSLGKELEPEEGIFQELPTRLGDALKERITSHDPSIVPEGGLADHIETFLRLKKRKGRELLRKVLENLMFEFYDLKWHGFFVDDVSRILDLLKCTRPGQEVKQFLKSLARVTRESARRTLGLFPMQTELVFRVGQSQATGREVDQALDEFAPRVMYKRLFTILTRLIPKESRFRLTLILYGRMRGLNVTGDHIQALSESLYDGEVERIVELALERKEWRSRLVQHLKDKKEEIELLESLF
jgi:hypothetical protein